MRSSFPLAAPSADLSSAFNLSSSCLCCLLIRIVSSRSFWLSCISLVSDSLTRAVSPNSCPRRSLAYSILPSTLAFSVLIRLSSFSILSLSLCNLSSSCFVASKTSSLAAVSPSFLSVSARRLISTPSFAIALVSRSIVLARVS